MPITEELLIRARTDKAALDELIVKLIPILKDWARRLAPQSFREDIVQSALRKILTNQCSIPPAKSQLNAWAYVILQNTWFAHLRRNPQTLVLTKDPVDPRSPAEPGLAEMVLGVLQLLQETDRQILKWIFYDGLSTNEICALLNVNADATYVRKHRALIRFQQMWERIHGYQ